MAHFEHAGFAPYGDRTISLPGGYVPDDGESVTCANCDKELPLIEGTDDDGNPEARFGDGEHTSLNGAVCCGAGCAALFDLDVREGLRALQRYFASFGRALPQMSVGFRKVQPEAFVTDILRRHEFALKDGHHVAEIVKEAIG